MEYPQPAGTMQGKHGHPQIRGSHIFNGGPNTSSPLTFEYSTYRMSSNSLAVSTASYLHAAQPSPGALSFPGGVGLAHQAQNNDWQTPFAASHASNSHAGLNLLETLGVAADMAAKDDAASGEWDTTRVTMDAPLMTIKSVEQMKQEIMQEIEKLIKQECPQDIKQECPQDIKQLQASMEKMVRVSHWIVWEVRWMRRYEAKMDESQMDGLEMDGSKMDESQMDGLEMDGSKMDESQMDGLEMDGSKMDESQMDGLEMDGSEMDESQMVESETETQASQTSDR